jgi:hypothetical protein
VRQDSGGESTAPGEARGTTLARQSSASWRCSSRRFFASLVNKPQFQAITGDILFILILVELFRLLIIDLQEQRVAV